MDLITEMKKIKAKEILLYCTFFLSTLAPGFLLIYQYKPKLVMEYSILKLVLFSASLTLPVLFLNYIFVAAAARAAHLISLADKEKEFEVQIFVSCLVTFLSYYIVILAAYFFSLKFTIFIAIMLGLEFIVVACCNLIVYLAERKQNKRDKSANHVGE